MMQLANLVGLVSLASGWMLFWALAAAIPLVVHLFSRRARNVAVWAAMDFLQSALRKHARRMRLEQLLLVALRMLILLLLAVASAQPLVSWTRASGSSARSPGREHVIVVLDGSYSMGCTVGEKSRFERAKEEARHVVSESEQGDGFSVLVMADPPQPIIADVAFDRDDIVREIDRLQLTHGGAMLLASLDEIERLVESAADRRSRIVKRRVLFFTDLGRTTWDDVALPECRERIRRLAQRATLNLIDVGEAVGDNVAILRFATDTVLPVVNDRVSFEVELQNFGAREAAEERVELLVDGRSAAERSVSVAPGARTTLSFVHRFEAAGEHVIAARISGDPLDLDNRRWLSLPVRDTISVLCLQGQPEESRYVALALAPERVGPSRVRVEQALDSALLELDLSPFDCVWLCNVGRVGREESRLLHQFVHRGGGLITTLGDRVQAENYQQELGGELSGKRVLPARLDRLVGGPQHRFDPLDYQHPIVAPFRGYERAGLLTAPVWRYWKLVPYSQENGRVAMAFENADPAVVVERLGQGQSILVATTFSLRSVDRTSAPPIHWTALPTWPSFAPLVQNLLQAAVQGKAEERNVQVGQPLSSWVAGGAAGTTAAVTGPAGRVERVPVQLVESEGRWHYERAEWSGVYSVECGLGNERPRMFAANVDAREGDLARLDRASLPAQFKDTSEARSAGMQSAAGSSAQPLARLVLGLLLVLLLGESFVARRLGDPSS